MIKQISRKLSVKFYNEQNRLNRFKMEIILNITHSKIYNFS